MSPLNVSTHQGIESEQGLNDPCTNLHAAEDGPRPLSSEIEKMISALESMPRTAALSSSLSPRLPVHVPAARRCPLRAKRRAWQLKTSYQRARCKERLRPWQIEALFEADNFARHIGLPLNVFVTISWNNTQQGADKIPKRFSRATKAMGQWMNRRNCKAAWIFTHENPENSRPNVHLLVHIPADMFNAFAAMAPRWFDALDGGVHLRRRNGPRDRCLSYMTKGTDFVTARRHGGRARKQGIIDFKRCGWTENLGADARQRSNIQSRDK